jgi:hypothetical protein
MDVSIYRVAEQYRLSLSSIHEFALDLGFDISDSLSPSQLEAILTKAGHFTPSVVQEIVRKTEESKPSAEQARKEPKSRWKKRKFRKEMIELAKSYAAPITGEQWNYFRHIAEKEFADAKIPTARQIINEFGAWYIFWEYAGRSIAKDNPTDNLIRGRIRQMTERPLEEICLTQKLTRKAVEQYLLDRGILDSRFIEQTIQSVGHLAEITIPGLPQWNGPYKKLGRDNIISAAKKFLPDLHNVSYLGLPSANFIDYLLIHNTFGIDQKQSLVAENDPVIADAISSILANAFLLQGGELFNGLTFHPGNIHDALLSSDKRFNFIFLDYLGGWCEERKATLTELVSNHLADEAILFLTMKNDKLERMRVQQGRGMITPSYGTDDQYAIAKSTIECLCSSFGYISTEVFPTGLEYVDETEMLIAGFVMRKQRKQSRLEQLINGHHKQKNLVCELHYDGKNKAYEIRLHRIHSGSGNQKLIDKKIFHPIDMTADLLLSDTQMGIDELRKRGYTIAGTHTSYFKQQYKREQKE